ncbi:MAG: hypothetical protein PVF68_12280, partial [Acidobacteriota bacterium]
ATPDGKTIVYSAALEGNVPEVFAMDPEFPEPRSLGLVDVHFLALSSQQEMALLTDAEWAGHRLFEGTLARMPLGGGAPRELIEKVRQADWTPDGTELAIIRDVDGVDRLEFPIGNVLHEASGYLSDLRFSPDGKRIAFFEHPLKGDDRGSVDVVDLAGNVTVLSDGYWGLEGLGWTPDGRDIVFSAGTGYSNFAIYRVDLAGAIRPALQSAGGLTFHAILPGGRWLVTRDESQRGLLALAPGEEKERDLAWLELSVPSALSADGRTLLFTEAGTAAGVNYAVCLRKTDGSPVVRLGEGFAADLSPDGAWALSLIPSTPAEAVLYPTGPGEPRHLERGTLEQYQDGKFFPDGRSVLLEASADGRAPRCWAQELAGGPPRPVTPEGTSSCLLSPAGDLVLASDKDRRWNLYPLSGGEPVPVSGLTPDERVSRFAPHGRSLIVYERMRIPARVTRVDIADGGRTLLREIAPRSLAGVMTIGGYLTSDDEASYVYGYYQYETQLFLVEGMR